MKNEEAMDNDNDDNDYDNMNGDPDDDGVAETPADDDDGDDNNGDEEDDILDEIDIEYEKLQQASVIRKENICATCEMSGNLIDCQGSCLESFHLDCIGLMREPKDGFKCEQCTTGLHACFACKKPSNTENMARKCSLATCGRYYHDECAKTFDIVRNNNKDNKFQFTCPLHACLTCLIESRQYAMPVVQSITSPTHDQESSSSNNSQRHVPLACSAATLHASKGRFMRCVRCPTAYHAGDYCIAAGSIVLAGCNIVCPNHFQAVKGLSQHNRANVSWCFVCCKTVDLLGCDSCPAAYHYACLDNPPALDPNKPWVCEDCERNKRPVYGEILWVKVGVYRWWPAQICHPRNLPKNVRDRSHGVGEFPVRFFGTNDYFWVTRNRCFAFAEDDECTKTSSKQKGLAVAFQKGVYHAQIAFKHVQKLRLERFNKLSGRDTLKCAKSNFQIIKTNKPVGNVQIHRVALSDLPSCDCDPKEQNPCGTEDCLNRILKYECHPSVCPAGERCQNQRFVKRLYPRQEPRQTSTRGWGLYASSDIKKGEFVNEYVGELIDDEECKRRLELSYQNEISNFYFLTIDKDRLVLLEVILERPDAQIHVMVIELQKLDHLQTFVPGIWVVNQKSPKPIFLP
jgi:histone-lysine N-methyltransferase NSD1